jgi:hypothetical protein
MILQENLALGERAMVAVRLAGSAVDDLGPILAFAVSIHASVKWVLQRGDDVAISDRGPFKRNHSLAIRWARKMDFLGL